MARFKSMKLKFYWVKICMIFNFIRLRAHLIMIRKEVKSIGKGQQESNKIEQYLK